MRVSFARAPEAFRAVSAADVMAGRVDAGLLDNAWVLVGGTAFGMADIVPTPYSGATYGVELQARLLASLLDVDVPYTPAGAPLFLFGLCLAFTALLYVLVSRTERLASVGLPVAALVLPLVAAAAHGYVLATSNLWLGWALPALYGCSAALVLVLLEMARVRLERSRVFDNLNSYLPDSVARDIAFSLPSSSIAAQRVDVTLLNADLRNFSVLVRPERLKKRPRCCTISSPAPPKSSRRTAVSFRSSEGMAFWRSGVQRTSRRQKAH